MKNPAPLLLLALAACALPGSLQAQGYLAVTGKSVHVRAGPARDYPIVAVLPPGYQIAVQGCLPDYTWCDVIAGPSRGWIYAGNINYAYQNAYVPVLTYGSIIGIGVLAFVLDDYWGRHYHNRPWYGERQRWINHPAPHYRPSPRPGVPPPRSFPRAQNNPSGGVLPGPHPQPRQGAPGQLRNPSGGVLPGAGAPPHQGAQPRAPQRPQPGVRADGAHRPQSGVRADGAHRPDHQRR